MLNPIVTILRVEEDENYGTLGVLLLNAEAFCVTLEPPDLENAQNVSSIPAQQYVCERTDSDRYGKTFEIKHVPGRTHVLFHAGNVAAHTKGCVLLGEYFGKLRGQRAVLNSGKTFSLFMEALADYYRFKLTIREVY